MPAIEVIPPERPIHEDRNAPVIYLYGQASIDDSWNSVAVDHLRSSLRRSDTVYIANSQHPHEANPDDISAWNKSYRTRALDHGAVIIWITSSEMSNGPNQTTWDLLNIGRAKMNPPLVVGAGYRNNSGPRTKLKTKLEQSGLGLFNNIHSVCEAAIALCTKSDIAN